MDKQGHPQSDDIRKGVRAYYGTGLRTNDDLRTNACCCGSPDPIVHDILPLIDDGILNRFAPYFTLTGDRSTHLGKFEGCGDKTSDERCGCGSINEVKNPSVHEI